ncbi:putative protein phosphatase CG10417 [Lycorma delicatula]|uniref:putative protein phosphatase CG10417 n=1 Tax=Lycorma delicatula TaxID=130591 RepID=UPI003F50E11F
MGGYLSEPIKDKESSDYEGERLICGASSMQGWRATQEDAHNCIVSYDENASLFAVYDGHGGHEVAEYAAKHLPDFIKETEAYKSGNYEMALIDSFLGFDATLATPKVTAILKRIAGSKDTDKKEGEGDDNIDKQNEDEDEEDEDDEENLEHLCKEAHMPLEQLIDKYRKESSGRFKFNSPNVRSRKGSSSSGPSTSATSSSEANGDDREVSSSSSMQNSESSTPLTNGEVDVSGVVNETSEAGSSSDKCNGSASGSTSHIDAASSNVAKADLPDSSSQSQNKEKNVSSSNGEISDESNKISSSSPEKKDITKSVTLTRKLLCSPSEDDSDTDSDDDETFEGGAIESSDEEEGGEVEGEEDEEEDEEEEDEEEDEDYVDEDFGMPHSDEPGSDSGCTAVVALLKGNDLYVANAGDSRCVVCHEGNAIEMSIDHKPEDKIEMDRIIAAGGKVSRDGRVNGGLNLSRALGDHTYKQVKTLPATEQMITALPDIKKLEVDPAKDEFIVLACDGIWNYMTSQDVVDFIRQRLNRKTEKMSTICEDLFDHCLAPNTLGDGTGCDNMTCIIVQLKHDGMNGHDAVKRSASSMGAAVGEEEEEEDVSTKRQKLDSDTSPVSVASK